MAVHKTNLQTCLMSAQKSALVFFTLCKIPFYVIGRCSLMPTSHGLQGKCARIKLSPAASGMVLHNQRRLPASIFNVKIAALKRVTGRSLKICKFKGEKI
jgi:hypothetical protein